jgi:virginiamycin B lyase
VDEQGFRFGARAGMAVAIAGLTLATTTLASGITRSAGASAGRDRRGVARAPRYIYWSSPETFRGTGGPGIETIGRAEIDGSDVDKSFVTRGTNLPGAVAVDGRYIYWVNSESGAIARANLDRTHVKERFVPIGGITGGLAINGHYIYWGSGGAGTSSAKIGRADLDGTHVDPRFISVGPGTYIGGVAVGKGHIYWTNRDKGTVGEAGLDGAHVNPRLVRGAKDPNGLAIEKGHLYWANDPTSEGTSATIGRAQLDGSHVKESFIEGVTEPFGVAADAHHIYWTNYRSGTIGRAGLNGARVDQSFIVAGASVDEGRGEGAPMGLAVGP